MLLTKTLLVSLLTGLNFLCFSPTSTTSKVPPQESIEMSAAQFQIYGSLSAVLDNFDFDAVCKVTEFRLVRVAKRSDPAMIENRGGIFTSSTQRLVDQASSGDIYFFEEIKARCPEDPAARPLAGLVVRIM
jgi:hypothetical protein